MLYLSAVYSVRCCYFTYGLCMDSGSAVCLSRSEEKDGESEKKSV